MIKGEASNWVLGIGMALALGLAFLVWFNHYYDFADICFADEAAASCARNWIGALSGWVAAAAAGITVLVIYHQTKQFRYLRADDQRLEAVAIADTLLIDLLDTSNRIRAVTRLEDLDPPWSTTARGMVRDATKVNPALAAALQHHCSEVGALASRLRSHQWASNIIPPHHLMDRDRIAYRAYVLSYCFGTASTQLTQSGKATGPFLSETLLTEWEASRGVTNHDRKYLQFLFNHVGLE